MDGAAARPVPSTLSFAGYFGDFARIVVIDCGTGAIARAVQKDVVVQEVWRVVHKCLWILGITDLTVTSALRRSAVRNQEIDGGR